MTELDFEYLRDVLDNITYWETCPETYRQRFKTLIKQIDEHRKELKNNVTLGSVSKCLHPEDKQEVLISCKDCKRTIGNKDIFF